MDQDEELGGELRAPPEEDDSLKVLDFSTLIPGPFATMVLADLGADVVRVEAPDRGDAVRELPPGPEGGESAWHGVLGRSKRSICLDLKSDAGAEVVGRLLAGYDIVVEQFRPGVMERLGLGYEAIAKEKLPDLNATTLAAACLMIEGTARSMGVEIEG